MKLIFYREGQEGQSLFQFLHENKIEIDDYNFPSIRIDYEDWIAQYYLATNGNYYKEFNSCGYENYLYQFDSEEEFKTNLTDLLVNRFKITEFSNPTK